MQECRGMYFFGRYVMDLIMLLNVSFELNCLRL